MLIIEIHVDTVEKAEPATADPATTSTRKIREDDRPTRAKVSSKKTENRFWNAIKLSFPGSLKPKNKNER